MATDKVVDELDLIDRRLIDRYQRSLPLVERPFAAMAEELGLDEQALIERLQRLCDLGVVGRVGAVFDHRQAGASELVAVAVPDHRREAVAQTINACPGVNHNYWREHRYNLWFVVTAPDSTSLELRLTRLEAELGTPLLRLPMVQSYHIDLAFALPWAELEES
ncbi:Lrp/AsnC family transcriptional regulator [Halomonas litopenaei]|uniref:Lrp/AsnC family transcriptional regulator n=1 Tax=Halomonas litopenaei TaxID=2109328 RepID=UPI000C59D085|nr:AsnC family protein [Halomonas sp.]